MDNRIEAVARAYCRRMGLDPDEKTWGESSPGSLQCSFRPYWRTMVERAREAIAMQEAIAEVMAVPKTPTKAE